MRALARCWIGAVTLATLLSACSDSESPTGPAIADEPSFVTGNTSILWERVTTGWDFTCGVGVTRSKDQPGVTYSRAYCWGKNHLGQLGQNEITAPQAYPAVVRNQTACPLGPRPIQPDPGCEDFIWTEVSAGADHVCGLASPRRPVIGGERREPGRTLFCWGGNAAGQLGINQTVAASLYPYTVGQGWDVIDAGHRSACGTKRTGGTHCWGLSWFGQLGIGTPQFDGYTSPQPVDDPERPLTPIFQKLAHGYGHVCGLSGTSTHCWGLNDAGQVGDPVLVDNARQNHVAPYHVTSAPPLVNVTAGLYHTCGLTQEGNAFCWGANDLGQLGRGTTGGNDPTPTRVLTTLRFTSIDAGGWHTCAVAIDGTAHCWGWDGWGQLGNVAGDAQVPSAVAGGQIYSSISADFLHTCGVTLKGKMLCWGDNSTGQLGTGVVGGEDRRIKQWRADSC